ncbi:GGDEF domain-containing protein [Actinoplanes sp. NPDC020271]|uniref:GGDEF domain-containing protein n=1 Tax=Actinoplanes sp. NPDC020271 TaxID=3363896 RepID=UPI00379437A6
MTSARRAVRPRLLAWRLWLALVAACALMRVVLPDLGASYLQYEIPYLVVSAGAPVIIAAGVLLNRPPRRSGWLTLCAGQTAYAAGDALSIFDVWSTGDFVEPAPADICYLSSYALVGVAVFGFIRRRTPGWNFATAVDALIVALSAGLLTWVFFIQPLAATSMPMAAKLTEAAYPMLDLMLLILAVRLVLGAGNRSTVLRLLLGYLVLMFAADSAYAVVGIVGGENASEAYLGGLWMLSLGMLAACALHPAMRDFDQRSPTPAREDSVVRFAGLTVAVLMVPGLQLVEHLFGTDLNVTVASVSCISMFMLVMMRMAELIRAQHRAAVTDALTGVRNRRHFETKLVTECRRAARSGHGIGLLMVDLDHFKNINDTYGHQAGDRVLHDMAQRLLTGRRAGTVLARYGGEEFVVLVPHVDQDELVPLAERIRRSLADLPIEATEHTLITVTASIGAAWSPGASVDPAHLLRAADKALYAAKAAGRNRVVAASTGAASGTRHGQPVR